MGVNTQGYLKGYIKPEYLLNYIKQKYDANATMTIRTHDYGEKSKLDFIKETYDEFDKWLIEEGRINFIDGIDQRSLFYMHDNINSYENLEYHAKNGLEDMVKQEKTSLSLGCWGNSVEIMRDLVSQFGGWIDENDCDDEDYYPISKDTDGNITPVILVTMEEIYQKFGGVVIIKDQ